MTILVNYIDRFFRLDVQCLTHFFEVVIIFICCRHCRDGSDLFSKDPKYTFSTSCASSS